MRFSHFALENYMRLRSFLTAIASLLLVAIMLLTGASSSLAQPGPGGFTATRLEADSQYEGTFLKGDPNSDALTSLLIKINAPSLLSYDGSIPGLAATSPAVTGQPLDLNSPAARAYLAYLNSQIDASIASLRALVPDASVIYRYDLILGGFAVRVPVASLDQLARVANLRAVLPDEIHQLNTYGTPEFIGATSAWAQTGNGTSAGEGVVVGILDSGIWPEHPSFADPDPLGRPFAPPPASWTSNVCDFGKDGGPSDPAFDCNNKLIGAQRFMDAYEFFRGLMPYEFRSARDDDGHGTHTAGTAAGNAGVSAEVGILDFGSMAGIAPRAHVAAYKVCGEVGCYSTDSAAAIQQAILDGVDVLNFSISGGTNPYSDVVALAFLDAYNAGVFVAASGGNSGPGANTVNHRGGWITTVAASTSNQAPLATANLSGPSGALALTGVSVTEGIPTATPVVINSGDLLCQNPAPAGSFTGQVVVCQRGVNPRVEKSANVAAGGAVGMLLYNTAPSSTDGDAHSIPSIHLNFAEGQQLLSFLAANPGATVSWADPQPAAIQGDVIAGFSSRGGSGLNLGIAKPDITAPGVNILAAYTSLQYGVELPPNAFLSGTSMSGPHVAGAGALIKALYPDWTPGQIKSALMTTASGAVVKEDSVTPATPFDTGSGRVDLSRAWNPGITFDVSAQEYVDYQNQLWKINYPSLYIPQLYGTTTIERTARNVSGRMLQYQLSVEYPAGQPNDFTLDVVKNFQVAPGASHTFAITVGGRDVPLGAVRHATILMRENGGQASTLRFPVSFVRAEAPLTLSASCDPAQVAHRATTNCAVSVTNTTFAPADFDLVAQLPKELQLIQSSVSAGATSTRTSASLSGEILGAQPPIPGIGPGGLFGYIPLSSFGIAPLGGVGDESIANFNVPPFTFAGESYTRIGMVSNGYAVVGGGSGADVDYINQILPDATRPNNVLAPFWTDLNPGAGGALRVGLLSSGPNSWLVLDWENVPEWSSIRTASFQIWIGLNGSEDVVYTYGPRNSNGDGGLLTVGVENAFGNQGQSYYANGVGTLPVTGNQLRVTSQPGTPGETRTLSFNALGFQFGPYTLYANLESSLLDGTSTTSFSGEVLRR
jgi:subtilisin family serine protease